LISAQGGATKLLVRAVEIATARNITPQAAGSILKKYCSDLKVGNKWPFDECMERLNKYIRSHHNPKHSERDQQSQAGQQGFPYEEAKRLLINVQFQQEMLKLQQMKDNFIDKNKAQNEVFQYFRTLRDAVLSVPDRLSAQLTNTDEITVRNTLNIELRKALEQAKEVEL
jgi:phage terminase Nu1 subunit (DNA packaging protein)